VFFQSKYYPFFLVFMAFSYYVFKFFYSVFSVDDSYAATMHPHSLQSASMSAKKSPHEPPDLRSVQAADT